MSIAERKEALSGQLQQLESQRRQLLSQLEATERNIQQHIGALQLIEILQKDSATAQDDQSEEAKSPTVYLCKNDESTFTATTNAASEIEEGFYKVVLTTSELDTDGDLAIYATATGTDRWVDKVQVVTASTGPFTVTLSETQMENIADEVLRRAAGNADASSQGDAVNQRSLLALIRLLLNRTENNTGTGELDVYEEDDTTIAFSIPVTTVTYDNAAVITARNPSG